jgi:hypothetical protein
MKPTGQILAVLMAASIFPTSGQSVPAVAAADNGRGESLCQAGERVVLSASVENSDKIASICSSTRLDDRHGYLQYRFGRPGKVELQFPSSRKNTQKAFTYSRYTRPLVTYLTLAFSAGGYRYSIHQDNDSEIKPASNAAYITVVPLRPRSGEPAEATIKLAGRVMGSLMSLEDVVVNEPRAYTFGRGSDAESYSALETPEPRRHETWPASRRYETLVQAALTLVGNLENLPWKTSVEVFKTDPQIHDGVTMIITRDGLRDESMRSEKYRMQLEWVSPGNWKAVKTLRTQRCWPGRGHERYEPTPCR